jgi:5-methylcytosine-specific restriction endonuclease McrA
MSARQAITEKMKVDSLLWHASMTPFPIRCGICKEPIIPMEREKGLEWDHIVALAFDGDHAFYNLRPLHKACHRLKTSGTKATTAGSDIHMTAKAKRIARGGKKSKRPMKSGKRVWPKRPFSRAAELTK